MQTTTQTPALLKRTTKRTKQPKTTTLTQAQVQSLVSLLKENIQIEQRLRLDTLQEAKHYWEHCNPDDPHTIVHFTCMNWLRDEAKYHKEKIAKLNKLQNTLKKMR